MPGGQSPLNVRRLAGVARILPVHMPARFELEVQTRIHRSPGIEVLVGKDQLHMQVRNVGGIRRRKRRQRRRQQNHQTEDIPQTAHATVLRFLWDSV